MSCAYSDSYRDARSRFRAAARNIGAELEAQLVQGAPDSDQNLTIDIARVGAPNPAWSVIVSSGLHGVEGFLGSAIQISSLKQLSVSDLVESGGEFILIHAINPFGFQELRRVNEDNESSAGIASYLELTLSLSGYVAHLDMTCGVISAGGRQRPLHRVIDFYLSSSVPTRRYAFSTHCAGKIRCIFSQAQTTARVGGRSWPCSSVSAHHHRPGELRSCEQGLR